MTKLQLLALIAMSAIKDRSEIIPSEFHGIKAEVSELLSKPVVTIQKVLKSELGLEWNGRDPLWQFIVESARQECMIERAHHLFGSTFIEVDKAYRYLEAHKQLTQLTHEPGSEVLQHIELARKIVLGTVLIKPEDVEEALPEMEAA